MTRRITSVDIARHAGVSRTTVSFVLNQVPGVLPATRDKVLKAAQKLGYVPNSAARMLVSGRNNTLGLVISRPDLLLVDAFIPRLLYGIERVCNDCGYKLLVDAVDEASNTNPYLDLAHGKRIDGLIVLNPRTDDRGLIQLIDKGFPLVIIGSTGHPKENSITVDLLPAGRAATNHLLALGHRRIAHISFAPLSYLGARARYRGYREALKKARIRFDKKLLVTGDFSSESGFEAMKQLLQGEVIPTAVFVGNDTLAIGAMAAIRAAGLAVPGDISVVGFDDLPFAAFSNPALTTVRVPASQLGEHAARAAIELLNGKPVGIKRGVASLELIVRESSARPKLSKRPHRIGYQDTAQSSSIVGGF
jgi:DNA-binding LacI/PurR family transcriptional regulator